MVSQEQYANFLIGDGCDQRKSYNEIYIIVAHGNKGIPTLEC